MYIYICFGGVGSHLQLLDPVTCAKNFCYPKPKTIRKARQQNQTGNVLYTGEKKTAAFVFAFVVLFFWATTPLQPDRPTPGDLVSFFLPYFRAFLCAFSSISGFGVGRKLNN